MNRDHRGGTFEHVARYREVITVQFLRRFIPSENRGRAIGEYLMTAGLIGIVALAVFIALSPTIADLFDESPDSRNLGESQYQTSQTVYATE